MKESTRAYIYRVLLAAQPVVVAYGLLSDTLATLWLSVASAVLGLGLATVNTSTEKEDEAGSADLLLLVYVAIVATLLFCGVHLHLR